MGTCIFLFCLLGFRPTLSNTINSNNNNTNTNTSKNNDIINNNNYNSNTNTKRNYNIITNTKTNTTNNNTKTKNKNIPILTPKLRPTPTRRRIPTANIKPYVIFIEPYQTKSLLIYNFVIPGLHLKS